jgi:hypothetical protein
MHNLFTVFIITILVTWIVCELFNLAYQGLHNYIKGNGKLLLEKELSSCWLNSFNDDIISLNNKSDLNGNYIAKTGTSILFTYYFSSQNGIDYGILIFSDEYFMIKNKFKELRRSSKMLFQNKNKRYKFKKI